MATPYAYWAEAALAHYEQAQQLQHEALHGERDTCAHYARAARAALNALLAAHSIAPEAGTSYLLAPLATLSRVGQHWGRAAPKAQAHARLLSRVLILDQTDAGADYLARDLFGADDVAVCQVAARFFLETLCQRFLGLDLEQTQLRFDPLRQPPMTHAALWCRRQQRLAAKRPIRS